MPRAKKPTSTAPSNISDISNAPAKRVRTVNLDPPNSGAKTNGEMEAAIRARAYQIYEERGRVDGLAQDDWVRAEREILSAQGKRTA